MIDQYLMAHLDEAHIGEEYLDTLSDLKSKDEIIAEIVTLLSHLQECYFFFTIWWI